ncbi:MAG TPA: GntR family transcriptional regulator [Candidatus Limnocylindrales bacterium]|nr:GntR family transcriptional regulator [Candidatus Limnocylindrales bacterium]
MKIDQNSIKPIYLQIAEGIEDDILNGLLRAEEQAYSQYQIARQFNVNPATAAKGINLLVNEGILCKKRGLSMHVTVNARETIREKRRKLFVSEFFSNFMDQALKLNLTREDLKKMIDNHAGGA